MAPEFLHQDNNNAQEGQDVQDCVLVEPISPKAIHVERPLGQAKRSKEPVEIAFSASGGAFVYQMGVASYLQEHFDLSECHISGCSGGSWAAALLASRADVRQAFETIKTKRIEMVQGTARWYSGYGIYASIINAVIHETWKNDPDALKRMEENHLSIAVTRFPSMKPERLTSWESVDDLAKSILASCMIPFALSGKPWIAHRGAWYVDGGLTNFKGVNCDKYSTLADFTFHGAQMVLDATRSINSRLADWFFPSWTKPIADYINASLPVLESPHEAIAPREVLMNPQDAGVECTVDQDRPRIIIMPWTWRSTPLTAYHLSLDMTTHQQRFDNGYEDARQHHDDLAALLPLRAADS